MHSVLSEGQNVYLKCGLIERVSDADSNEPSLASIRELESSQKDDTRKHVTNDDVRTV